MLNKQKGIEEKKFNFYGDIRYYLLLMGILAILEVCMGTLEIFPKKK